MLLSSLAACFINGFGFRNLGRLLFAALTIGFICMFFVVAVSLLPGSGFP